LSTVTSPDTDDPAAIFVELSVQWTCKPFGAGVVGAELSAVKANPARPGPGPIEDCGQ
jgi:hypothetical protein